MDEPKENSKQWIKHIISDPVINIAKDTILKSRQLIVFVNTKRAAESQAEKIASKMTSNQQLHELSEKILRVLPTPTKQCKRLARCVEKGTAFHHAGLHSKQRDIVEEGFRHKIIKVICATPTLAAGVDLPAFRVIVRDLKRYGGRWGMTDIPVLEFEQMSGRAGRPGKDPWGEAICIAKDESEAEKIVEQYFNGEPEEIYSKLAVEPVLRTYVLSLVAGGFVKDYDELHKFFRETFYAHQYGDLDKLRDIIDTVIEKLEKWGFLNAGEVHENHEETKKEDYHGFVSASRIGQRSDRTDAKPLEASRLGRRVSEMYLDPYTAHGLIVGLKRSGKKRKSTFAWLHLASSCFEMRPTIRAKASETEMLEEKFSLEEDALLYLQPSNYSEEYEEYMNIIKTAMLFEDWIEESSEEELLEKYDVRPGELHTKLEVMDWLVYATEELARLMSFHEQRSELIKLRVRLRNGAKEELLPLLKLRQVGRVRARLLFKNNVKDVAGLKNINAATLSQLVGKAVAIKLKEQVGEKVDPDKLKTKPNKRKGQIALTDWTSQS